MLAKKRTEGWPFDVATRGPVSGHLGESSFNGMLRMSLAD